MSYQEVVHAKRYSRASEELVVSEATFYSWKRQAPTDADLAEDVKSFKADELAQAYRTIAELEAVNAAAALSNGEEPRPADSTNDIPMSSTDVLARASGLRGTTRSLSGLHIHISGYRVAG